MVWDKPTKLNQEEVKWSFIICILKIALVLLSNNSHK